MALDLDLAQALKRADGGVIGARIKAARTAAGLTQTDLANGVVTAAYISRIEQGDRRPRPKLLLHFAAVLGCPAQWFLADEPATPSDRERWQAELAKHAADALVDWLGASTDPQAYTRLVAAAAKWESTRSLGG